MDSREIDTSKLVDIHHVKIDPALPREQRAADYIRQIKNPYCFRCGEVVVQIKFSQTDATIEDKLAACICNMTL